jgi:hypothetical protein
LKSEDSKSTNVLDRTLPSRNLSTNLENVHTPKSTSKKPKGDNGDRKKKFALDRVLCENEAWQEADIISRTLEMKTNVCWENCKNTGHLASTTM